MVAAHLAVRQWKHPERRAALAEAWALAWAQTRDCAHAAALAARLACAARCQIADRGVPAWARHHANGARAHAIAVQGAGTPARRVHSAGPPAAARTRTSTRTGSASSASDHRPRHTRHRVQGQVFHATEAAVHRHGSRRADRVARALASAHSLPERPRPRAHPTWRR